MEFDFFLQFVFTILVMIKAKAKIKLYESEIGRTTPFTDGYRPLFNFVNDMKKSGQITLINKSEFKPGEEDSVEISFIDNQYLGKDFGNGKKFTFSEGRHALGEGEIIEVYNI